MVQLLGWAGGHIVLCIQPNLSSDFVGRCRASPTIIVPCHLICSMLESSFRLILHLGHSLGKVICSLNSGAPVKMGRKTQGGNSSIDYSASLEGQSNERGPVLRQLATWLLQVQ